MVRRFLDRVALPYSEKTAERVVELLGTPGEPVPAASQVALHDALHEARTLALADVPKDAKVVLSAGANGLWYFDWFEEAYGEVNTHIGVEAYMPRPEGLPANVEWVDADLASPRGVASIDSESIDLAFSGQNIEHLWPEQMVSFLCEANRVLKTGGLLVADSPNREMTSAYQWSMGEHTVELTPSEAIEVFDLAGFAVERLKGVWLCRESGRLLELEPSHALIGAGGLARRMALANERPEDSFIWWAEARKVRAPDPARLRKAVYLIFERSWPERVARLKPVDGDRVTDPDGRAGIAMPRGRAGFALIGPYMAVPAGTFEFSVPVSWTDGSKASDPYCRLDLVAGDELLSSTELSGGNADGESVLSCIAAFDDVRFAVHVRLWCSGDAAVRAPLTLAVSPDPWREPDRG